MTWPRRQKIDFLSRKVGRHGRPQTISCRVSSGLSCQKKLSSKERLLERLIILAFLKRANRINTSLAIRNCQNIINSLIFLLLQINLIRRRTPVLLQTYLPSGLFVVVSWISFIVPPEIVPGRQGAKQQHHGTGIHRVAMEAATS